MKKTIIILFFCVILLITAILFAGKIRMVNDNQYPREKEFFEERMNDGCVSNPDPIFTHYFTDLSKVDAIGILGGYGGASPGRSYVVVKKGNEVPVYAPTDATLETVIYAPRGPGSQPEYGFYFRASCEVTFLLDHIDRISDELENMAPQKPAESSRTELGSQPNVIIKAGTLLGYSNGTPLARTFDFLVMNKARPASHINQSRWQWEQALYGVCPYDYYRQALKEEHYAKLGTANEIEFIPEKICGSPSQDRSGTGRGGWFKNDSTDLKGEFLGIGQNSNLIQLVIRRDGNIVYRLDDYDVSESKKKPDELKTGESTCYAGNNSWVWIKLEREDTLFFAKGQGVCPGAFPATQAEIWQR